MLYLQASLWMVRMESNLKNRYDTLDDILEKRRDFIQTVGKQVKTRVNETGSNFKLPSWKFV